MLSRLRRSPFREPGGRREQVAHLLSCAGYAVLYTYASMHGVDAVDWTLPMAVAHGLYGVAESLPKDRQRAAGALRIVALLVAASTLVAAVAAPELVYR